VGDQLDKLLASLAECYRVCYYCDDHVTARSGVKISKGKGQSETGVF